MTLVAQHDLVDYINAASTAVVAFFTVAMFFVVKYQLRASKDIERAWVMLKLRKSPFDSMLLCETGGPHTTAFVQLLLDNEGNGLVWVQSLRARLVLTDSADELPEKPKLDDSDLQNWYPPPFVDSTEVTLKLTAEGSQAQKELCVVYGELVYQDKFKEKRISTFGYFIESGSSAIERLRSHPEYNRNN